MNDGTNVDKETEPHNCSSGSVYQCCSQDQLPPDQHQDHILRNRPRTSIYKYFSLNLLHECFWSVLCKKIVWSCPVCKEWIFSHICTYEYNGPS